MTGNVERGVEAHGRRVGPGADRSPWRRDARVWGGLLALCLGLLLLERSFAIWRNDPRNFPDAHGVVAAADVSHIPHTRLANHSVLLGMAGCGAVLLLLSVGLFSKQDQRDSH